MTDSSVVIIDNDNLSWIQKHPGHFVEQLLSRLFSGETDPYPGHARWKGDACPGVQVVHVGAARYPTLFLVKDGQGKKVASVQRSINGESQEVQALKALARKLGYNVVKNPGAKKKTGKGARS
jgi:hypothetical protein